MVLNISPISDPDDIRREAGIASPPPAQTPEVSETQTVARSTDLSTIVSDTVAPQPAPAEADAVNVTTPGSFHMDEDSAVEASVVSAKPTATAPESVQVQPAVAPPTIYPDPQVVKAQKQEQAKTIETQETEGYRYKLPVGVYVIAAGMIWAGANGILNSITLWGAGGIFRELGSETIWSGIISVLVGLALLTASNIIRWAVMVFAAISVLIKGKKLIDYIGELDGTTLSVVLTFRQLIICALFIGIIVYLTRPKVSKAFS